MATSVASACGRGEAQAAEQRQRAAPRGARTTPKPPISANSTKRTGTARPTSLSAISMKNSHTTIASSLLSPAGAGGRCRATRAKRSGRGEEASRSSRILKPWPERLRTAASNASRRITKKPLIGSAMSARRISRLTRVARSLTARPRTAPGADAAAGHVAAGDDDVDRLVAHGGEHRRQQRLVVLQIGIHDREDRAPRSPARPRCTRSPSPRRPMRCTQRTRVSTCAIARTAAAVPSAESSSTNTTSHAMPAST